MSGHIYLNKNHGLVLFFLRVMMMMIDAKNVLLIYIMFIRIFTNHSLILYIILVIYRFFKQCIQGLGIPGYLCDHMSPENRDYIETSLAQDKHGIP